MRTALAAIGVIYVMLGASLSGAPVSPADTAGLGIASSYRYYDQPIEPDRYLIRPGDKLSVTFINTKLPSLTFTVDPEGKIIDRTSGILDLSHTTLTEAKKILREALRKQYQADEIAITVSTPQKVSVTVHGAVAAPGLYTAYTSQRVSEVIDSAGGILPTGSHRNIVLSGGPRDIPVDLDRATYLGDFAANPCLYAGNNIYVPSKSSERVNIVGEVNFPREIELNPRDNVKLLLSLAGGITSEGDADVIEIIGVNGTRKDATQKIQAGDIIYIPSKSQKNDARSVTVFGAVSKPGKYDYREGMTVAQLLHNAGGFASNANGYRTTIFRKVETDAWKHSATERYPISHLVGNNNKVKDIPLQPSDSIYVPLKVGYVKVSGEVSQPGYFPFHEGYTAAQYIEAAGGFLPAADRKQVGILNRVSTVTSLQSPAGQVYDGDEIIVYPREELK